MTVGKKTNQKKSISILVGIALLAIVMAFFGGSKKNDSVANLEPLAPAEIVAKIKISDSTADVKKHEPSISEIEKTVFEHNKENDEQIGSFEENGWEVVEVEDPPDYELINLSPALLGNREEELQIQIQSNSFAEKDLGRLLEIALLTSDEKTRYVALEALGRSNNANSQDLLIKAFEEMGDVETRSQILGYLLPANSDDAVASFLTKQLAAKDLSNELKQQAAFPLAVFTIFNTEDEEKVAKEIKAQMPGEWQTQFDEIVALLKVGGKRHNSDIGR